MLRIAVVGYGQITKSQHVPVIREAHGFELVAIVDPAVQNADGLTLFSSLQDMVKAGVACDCVAICTPPSVRFNVAREAIALGLHVLLEKPPVVALSQLALLESQAEQAGVTLYTAWHSRHASCAEAAARLLKGQKIRSIEVCWKENHEKWHPGAKWLWKAGGYGCFDAGVNGLSLLQSVMDIPLVYDTAKLEFEAGAETPIRAQLALQAGREGVPVRAEFDIGYKGDQEVWTIIWHLDDGRVIRASEGGAQLTVDDVVVDDPGISGQDAFGEYRALYREFSSLISRKASEVYAGPYVIATDCLAHGRRV